MSIGSTTPRGRGTRVRSARAGGPALARGRDQPDALAVDSSRLYWVNSADSTKADGTVNEMPLGGGRVTTLARGQFGPASVAVDDTNVYWVNAGDATRSTGTV